MKTLQAWMCSLLLFAPLPATAATATPLLPPAYATPGERIEIAPGRHAVIRRSPVPGEAQRRRQHHFRQPGQVIADLHQRQRTGQIGGGNPQRHLFLIAAQQIHAGFGVAGRELADPPHEIGAQRLAAR